MLTERVDTTIESLRSDYLRCIGQKEITAAPEPVRLAIIELITRLEN